jgi:hypothetical protein
MRSSCVGLVVLGVLVALHLPLAGADPFQEHLGRYELRDVDKATATPDSSAFVRVHDRVHRPTAMRAQVNVGGQTAYPIGLYAKCSGRGNHDPFVIDEVVTGFDAHTVKRRFLRHAASCRLRATAEVQTGEVQIRLFAWIKRDSPYPSPSAP